MAVERKGTWTPTLAWSECRAVRCLCINELQPIMILLSLAMASRWLVSCFFFWFVFLFFFLFFLFTCTLRRRCRGKAYPREGLGSTAHLSYTVHRAREDGVEMVLPCTQCISQFSLENLPWCFVRPAHNGSTHIVASRCSIKTSLCTLLPNPSTGERSGISNGNRRGPSIEADHKLHRFHVCPFSFPASR